MESDTDISLMSQLTSLERRLVRPQLIVTVRGKRGRPVPLIIHKIAVRQWSIWQMGISRVMDNSGSISDLPAGASIINFLCLVKFQ